MKNQNKMLTTLVLCWKRRFLTLDRYMSGDFWLLFRNTLVISICVFMILWFVSYLIAGWSPGEAFIQLSNPSHEIWRPATEWLAIIIMNVFGLVVLNGVILTILVNWVSNRKDRHINGDARYGYIFERTHSVIIGGHKIVASLARDLIQNGKNEFVLIQTQRDANLVRKEIEAIIADETIARNVIIYFGDRTSWHELAELRLESAVEIYIIGEPFHIDGSSHDAINLQCWDLINRNITDCGNNRIPCHIMFEYQSTFNAFQQTDVKLEVGKVFRLIPFSIYENWAQQVLVNNKLALRNIGEVWNKEYYMPLDGHDGISYESGQRVHLIIIGMSKMGVSLAIEAAHIAHYPNFNNPATGRPRTLISFIDREARREMLYLMNRHRELFRLARWRFLKAPIDLMEPANGESWKIYDTIEDISQKTNPSYPWNDPMTDSDLDSPYYGGYLGDDFIDIDFEFIEGDIALPSVQKYISDACADNPSTLDSDYSEVSLDSSSKTTIAVCFPIAAESVSAALYFEPSVYENVQQIWVQQTESGSLIDTVSHGLTGMDNCRFRKLRSFGMIEQFDYLSRTKNSLPKIVAYAYSCMDKGSSLYEQYNKFIESKENNEICAFDDIINRHWAEISHDGGKSAIAKQWSNIYCANSFETKIRSEKLDLKTSRILTDSDIICRLAKVEHNRWIMEQLLLGFRPVDNSFAGRLPVEDKSIREELKRFNIHPDMVSNEILGSTQAYDEGITVIIPLAIDIANQIDNNRNTRTNERLHTTT